jgi:hypothetical protein
MAPAIADRRPKYVTKSCYVPMSESGQTLPMNSAPVPPDVRCCAKSDHSRRECEMTRRAMYGRRPRCKRNWLSAKRSGAAMYAACFSRRGLPRRDAAAVAAGPDVIR